MDWDKGVGRLSLKKWSFSGKGREGDLPLVCSDWTLLQTKCRLLYDVSGKVSAIKKLNSKSYADWQCNKHDNRHNIQALFHRLLFPSFSLSLSVSLSFALTIQHFKAVRGTAWHNTAQHMKVTSAYKVSSKLCLPSWQTPYWLQMPGKEWLTKSHRISWGSWFILE